MRNERGITLIELLVVIVLFSIIAIAVTTVTVQGLNNNEKIKQELILRDEAEILLATAVKSIYTTLESDVVKYDNNLVYSKVPQATLPVNIPSSLKQCENNVCTVVTGFITSGNVTRFYVKSVEIPFNNPNVIISNQSTIEPMHIISTLEEDSETNTDDETTQTSQVPTYKIKLGLMNKEKQSNNIVWFENEVTSINNK